jgi:hypothetical protein
MTTADPHAHPPTHGFTRLGQAVHKRTVDHLPTNTAYQRLNKKLALIITNNIGTMSCFWIFCVISLSSVLAVLYASKIIGPVGFLTAGAFILCVSWISQNFIQLVLLPALMVGQNLQNEAADARAAKTFEDVEDARESIRRALDLLDCHTAGGLRTILDAIDSMKATTGTGAAQFTSAGALSPGGQGHPAADGGSPPPDQPADRDEEKIG